MYKIPFSEQTSTLPKPNLTGIVDVLNGLVLELGETRKELAEMKRKTLGQ